MTIVGVADNMDAVAHMEKYCIFPAIVHSRQDRNCPAPFRGLERADNCAVRRIRFLGMEGKLGST
jgi:hypothetical protein